MCRRGAAAAALAYARRADRTGNLLAPAPLCREDPAPHCALLAVQPSHYGCVDVGRNTNLFLLAQGKPFQGAAGSEAL